jgi:hypothetical protein
MFYEKKNKIQQKFTCKYLVQKYVMYFKIVKIVIYSNFNNKSFDTDK